MQLTHQGSRFAKREEDGEDVCYISLIFLDLYILKLIWSKFLGDSLGENFCGFYCRRNKDLAFCKSARQVSDLQLASLSLVQQECCLFVFLDGSAHYFDDFLKVVVLFNILSSQAHTGEYRLQPGRVNGRPHYVRYNTTSVQLIPSLNVFYWEYMCEIDLKDCNFKAVQTAQ